jgi:cytochrome c biogenesis protein CcdA
VLLSDRARRAGPLYLIGFVTGISLATLLGLLLGLSVNLDNREHPPTAVSVVILAAGLLLLAFAAWSWQSRPKDGKTPVLPRWLRSLESLSPLMALGLGFALSVFSFKNLGLILVATLAIAQADLSAVGMIVDSAVFVVVACLGVALPVGWFILGKERSTETLSRWKEWLTLHNGWVTAASTALGGLLLVWKGLDGLIG